jgi:hypothetical protein
MHLYFKQIDTTSLIVNKKYLVVFQEGTSIRKLPGYYIKQSPSFLCFCMSSLLFNALRYFLSTETYFYEMIRQKTNIQNAMEKRATDKLLQRITGDELFTY